MLLFNETKNKHPICHFTHSCEFAVSFSMCNMLWQSDSKLAEGMNWGILTLMVVVYGVLMGIAGFFAYIIYRSKRLARSEDSEDSQLSG